MIAKSARRPPRHAQRAACVEGAHGVRPCGWEHRCFETPGAGRIASRSERFAGTEYGVARAIGYDRVLIKLEKAQAITSNDLVADSSRLSSHGDGHRGRRSHPPEAR